MIRERILQLPLFLGLSFEELLKLTETAKFEFLTKSPESTIVAQNTPCLSLYFVMEGNVLTHFRNEQQSYSIDEWSGGRPIVVQPECLFGLHTYYIRETRTLSTCQLLHISKKDLRETLLKNNIFMMNFLNLMASVRQQGYQAVRRFPPHTLVSRFTYFLIDRVSFPYGRKMLRIKMEDLSEQLLTPRLNVSRMLHELEEQELIIMHRGAIEIPDFEKLKRYEDETADKIIGNHYL